jgi:glycogen(starch) synthase
VLRSKAPEMVDQWNARYCLIGPDGTDSSQFEFEERRPTSAMARALEALEQAGLKARFGRWLISGRPRVILLDHNLPHDRLNELKGRFWADHGIEGRDGDPYIDNAISFADAVYHLFTSLSQHYAPRLLIGHFHEWMGAMAIPLIRRARLPVTTVFTTHATILGRYIASSRAGLYEQLPHLDDAAEARSFNITPIHQMERACAHGSHVFTTVSEVTGEECKHLLGREPDVYLPNGLNIERYEALHQLQYLHKKNKACIHRFVRGHFFPSYSFDLEKTLYFFTSGRYEPRNKGFDLCLESLARLNYEIAAAGLDVNVVFFIITRRPTRQIISECLERRAVLGEMRDTCQSIIDQVGERFFDQVVTGHTPKLETLVDDYWMLRLKRTMQAWRQGGNPPILTHVLEDEDNDTVLHHIRHLQLFNSQHDRVKIIYHPDFIGPANPLWKIEYDQFVRGCHLGVFPSSYEPWGYTPLECIASGIPAVTSDLAGFGRYVERKFEDHDDWGMWIINRRGREFHNSAAQLAHIMLQFCRLDRRERIELRNAAERHAAAFDWGVLGKAYAEAHDRAVGAVTGG